ncbi:hypothetical protein, partial [Mycolicibacterium porcinum]|uniref:hypothetical protein n=1 Tax=Mycolicibacterium porcinum TaxID=39693 RepID=UPI00256EBB11
PENPLAVLVQKVFDDRGKELTDYLKEQLTQAQGFVKTARDAAGKSSFCCARRIRISSGASGCALASPTSCWRSDCRAWRSMSATTRCGSR